MAQFFRDNVAGKTSKTAAKMTVARIKLLRNKRQAVVKQMRRDIALLLQSGQDATARVRVHACFLKKTKMFPLIDLSDFSMTGCPFNFDVDLSWEC